jgi:hypothetical protein
MAKPWPPVQKARSRRREEADFFIFHFSFLILNPRSLSAFARAAAGRMDRQTPQKILALGNRNVLY